jgi:hypothetical protein
MPSQYDEINPSAKVNADPISPRQLQLAEHLYRLGAQACLEAFVAVEAGDNVDGILEYFLSIESGTPAHRLLISREGGSA